MDIYSQIVSKIIKGQEDIIGPVAIEQAKKVPGLSVNWKEKEIVISGDKTAVLDKLIEQYQHLFGRASVEVCRDAVKDLISKIPQNEMPGLLK